MPIPPMPLPAKASPEMIQDWYEDWQMVFRAERQFKHENKRKLVARIRFWRWIWDLF